VMSEQLPVVGAIADDERLDRHATGHRRADPALRALRPL
jgi:hypothetical protein